MRKFAAESLDREEQSRERRSGGLSVAEIEAVQAQARARQQGPKLGDVVHDGQRRMMHGHEGLDF